MVKKLIAIHLVLVFFLSITTISEAQLESIIDEGLTINADIGQYKYSKPYMGTPSLSQEDSKIIDKVNIVLYNSTGTSDNKQIVALVYVMKFKKLSGPEQFIEKAKRSSINQLIRGEYKGESVYYSEGTFNGLSQLKLWQSSQYVVISIMGEFANNKPTDTKGIITEEVLDVYLEKYPVDYFNCPKMVYTQEMPSDGYQYVYDYDENGCESGRHVEPIDESVSRPVPTTTQEPIATTVPAPTAISVPASSSVAKEVNRNSCTDSDNGEDVYTKGTTSGYQDESYTNYWTRTDACNTQLSDNGFTGDSYRGEGVMEYFCAGDGVIAASYIKCSEGYVCQDGSCTGIDETGLRCTDPDQGDYFTRGMTCGYPRYPAVGHMNCVVDKCEGNNVIEYGLVGSDCVVGNNPHTCPNGCSGGACISVNTQEVSTKETSTGITGKVVDKITEDETIERAASAALKLELVRIDLTKTRDLIQKIADYYTNAGELDKSKRWSEISSMFGSAVGMVDGMIAYLKSTRDVNGAKNMLTDLRSNMKQISEKILSN